MPCTIVNSILAGLLAAPITLLWPPAGVVALVTFFGIIYLRGYLVPGTPTLTQRYLPEWVLGRLGKETLDSELGDIDAETTGTDEQTQAQPEPDELEAMLLEAGVVTECEQRDDLCLADEFNSVWWRRIRGFQTSHGNAKEQLASVIDVEPADLAFEDGENFNLTYEGDTVAQWVSAAAFYAELAAEPTLAEWLDDWKNLGDRQRTELLAGMRAFLEACPVCEAELERVEDVRQSCCSGEIISVSVDCGNCGAEVFSGSHR